MQTWDASEAARQALSAIYRSGQRYGVGHLVDILLGRDHVVEKMRRFAAIYERELKEQSANIARIDLRYANGLAVAWREPVEPAAAEQKVN